jgi:hypothetical protein
VNIFDRLLSSYGAWYQIGAPAGLFLFMWIIDRLLDNAINDDYRDNNFLAELLDEPAAQNDMPDEVIAIEVHME